MSEPPQEARMIRLCHVQLLPILSGVQRAMLEMIRGLDRSRYEVHVVCQGEGPLCEALDKLGVRVHFARALCRPLRPWRDTAAYRQLKTVFSRHRFHIVHTHSSKTGFLGRMAARRAGVPIVVHHVQGFAFHPFSPSWARWLYPRLERFAARYCDRMIFVNREDRARATAEGWLPAEHCELIYNGIDLAQYLPLAARRHPAENSDTECVIAFLGRLDFQKQPLMLAPIALALDRLRPAAKWRLVVAGSGPDEKRLRQRIEQLGVDHRVTLAGWHASPRDILARADIVLHPALFEGLPLALIEAQAAGLPIVASDAKGNREVVAAGTGLLCGVRDAHAYAARLAQLLDDPPLRRSLGRAARRHAESHFDARVTGQRIVDLYESLLAERGLAEVSQRPNLARTDTTLRAAA